MRWRSRSCTTARPTSRPCSSSRCERLRAVFRTSRGRARLHLLGHRRIRVGGRQPALAGRARALSCRTASSARAGSSWAAPSASTSSPLDYPWGETPRPADLAAALDESGAEVVRPRALGDLDRRRLRPRAALLATCREAGALTIVDAISSLGAVPLETDAWGADVVVTGSQKALMTPPGLCVRRRLRAGLGEDGDGDAAALLLGLGRSCARRRRRGRRRSRPPRRPSSRSPRRSGCCSRTGSRRRSRDTSPSGAPAGRA